MSTPVFNQIIRELCTELDIHCTELSDHWVFRLEKSGSVHFITGNRFDLNPAASGAIADDKVSTYEVLHNSNVPSIPHDLVYNPGFIYGDISPNFPISPSDRYLNSLHYPVVIKPNHGSRGRDVYLCRTPAEAKPRLDSLLHTDETICISPYFPAEFEYRCFFLDGEVLLIYGKKRDKNDSFHHNLSHGATPVLIDQSSELYKKLETLAIRAGHAIGIRFATVDILVGPGEEAKVLEINAGVTTTIFAEKAANGYELSKNIYREALKHLFSL